MIIVHTNFAQAFISIILSIFAVKFSQEVTVVELQRLLGEASAQGNVTKARRLLQLGFVRANWRDENTYSECGFGFEVMNGTALHRATACNSTEMYQIVQMLLDRGADVNATENYLDRTPLIFAGQNGQLETVRLLLDHGADVNAKNRWGYSPLINAVVIGNFEIVRLLLDRGADPNQCTKIVVAPIFWAARNGFSKIVKLLLEKGATVDAQNAPFFDAIRKGHLDTVRVFLDHDGNETVRVRQLTTGYCGLHLAAQIGKDLEIVRLLLDRGAEIDARAYIDGPPGPFNFPPEPTSTAMYQILVSVNNNTYNYDGVAYNTSNYGYTPLVLALKSGNLRIAELLLDRGADVNANNTYGYTPLTAAATSGNLDEIRLLINRSADINARNLNGFSALSYAASIGVPDAVAMLLYLGAGDNSTALIFAAQSGHTDVAELLLLDNGADINARDQFGYTPLIQAATIGLIEVVQYLIDFGADINATNDAGYTALMAAAANDKKTIVPMLISSGASLDGCIWPLCNASDPE